MTTHGFENHKSGKGDRDENFPVASFLISSHQRSAMSAYYRFARSADDAADHPAMTPKEKLERLEQLEKTLLGRDDHAVDALPLRKILEERGLTAQHALDLLVAFRQDVEKKRYLNWKELIDYCSFSANPVGRFILDIHGESALLYPESDILCTTLQIINHIQDCKKDYLQLDRVYLPLEDFQLENIEVDALAQERASLPLMKVLKRILNKTMNLQPNFQLLSYKVIDKRLSFEIAIIAGLAKELLVSLFEKDPLRDTVHFSKLKTFRISLYQSLLYFLRTFLLKNKNSIKCSQSRI